MEKIKKPSVSRILERIFWEVFDELPPFVLQKAIDKGNCIHERAEYYIKNSELLTCICKKPVKSHDVLFNNLINDLNKLDWMWIIKSEERFENEDLVGIIDLQVFKIDENNIFKINKILLVDFKTNSKVHISKWKYQLIMYAYLHNKSWDIDWNMYELEIWHYNINHKDKTIHTMEKPTSEELNEIQRAMEIAYKNYLACVENFKNTIIAKYREYWN